MPPPRFGGGSGLGGRAGLPSPGYFTKPRPVERLQADEEPQPALWRTGGRSIRATVRNGVQQRSRAIAIQEVSGRQGSIPGGLLVAGLLPIICLLLVVVPR